MSTQHPWRLSRRKFLRWLTLAGTAGLFGAHTRPSVAETPPQPLRRNLTGAWAADYGAIYYLRHLSDNSIWWAGLHNSGFHLGIFFTNVFRGIFNPTNRTIEGAWADVPRGSILQHGRLSLDVVEIGAPDDEDPQPPPGEPRGGATRRLELRQKPEGTTGGFGGRVWRRWSPLAAQDITNLADRVRRFGNSSLRDNNPPYRDFTVMWGTIQGGAGLIWEPDRAR